MKTIDADIFNQHYDNLFNLINYFTDSIERTNEIINNLKQFIDDGTAMVAGHIIENQLVSFIWCYKKSFSGNDRIHVSYFIVAEDFRGKGLSKDLILYAKRQAQENCIEEIDLNVEPTNIKAIEIYHKSGFITEKLQLVMKIDEGDL